VAHGVHVFVLNHSGRPLLEECLPSVVACARATTRPCRVTVIDNESSDDSVHYLRRVWPEVAVLQMPNRGLVSFNDAVRFAAEPLIVLLNNDVKLAAGCLDHLVAPIERDPNCFLTGPQCWGFDGAYEGTRSALCFRRGFVHTRLQPVSVAGSCVMGPVPTASAGAVLAVQREKFLALGGFDSLFLPGRYEDLDLAFRGWLAGWHATYVSDAVAYHKRSATFGSRLGDDGIRQLDVRNALLFAWKNLRGPTFIARHLCFLVLRLLFALATGQRAFLAGCMSAVRLLPAALERRALTCPRVRTERELFTLLRWEPCGP
jgi:N-acetylglucosaminyl-diphospho-decaprenol L-rhamnosyltransferase